MHIETSTMQVFHPATNPIAKASILGVIVILCGVAWVAAAIYRSSFMTGVGVAPTQPVPFSHEHHVRGLGIQCRYCHTTVQDSSFAGMPSTHTCMTCHSQIWNKALMLEPVRQSYASDQSLVWKRVYALPDFVYFDHGIHVNKGIGCATCHGQVDSMAITWKQQTLQMTWCLDCHRAPERYIRPRDQVLNMDWQPGANQIQQGRRLIKEYDVKVGQLTDCSMCHR